MLKEVESRHFQLTLAVAINIPCTTTVLCKGLTMAIYANALIVLLCYPC